MNYEKQVSSYLIATQNKKNNSNYYNICNLKYLNLFDGCGIHG